MKASQLFMVSVFSLGLMACLVDVSEATAMGTDFTYQGRLIDSDVPADGVYEFQFKLYDSAIDGIQIGFTDNIHGVEVIDGYFTVELGFGSGVFDGDARWLEIEIRSTTTDPYTILSPRQEVRPAPYALYAASGPGAGVPFELSGSIAYPESIIKGTNSSNGYGIYGVNSSSGNYGWLGGSNYGAYGRDFDSGNFGYLGGGSFAVYGSGTTDIGVYGYSDRNHGVHGYSDSSYGVYGKQRDSGNFGYLGGSSYGVYGETASPTGYAGYFKGGRNYFSGSVGIGTAGPSSKLQVHGTIYSSSGGFKFPDGSTQSTAYWDTIGASIVNTNASNVGIGIAGVPTAKLTVGGDILVSNANSKITTPILEITGGSDLSEQFEIRTDGNVSAVSAGMVVSIDAANSGDLVVCSRAYDRRVAGIISGAGGIKTGMLMGQKGTEADGSSPVALSGRVYCFADASNGSIAPGDLLTTSDIPGHAMKVTDYPRSQGAILGKAMSGLEHGRGLVLVLVSLQ